MTQFKMLKVNRARTKNLLAGMAATLCLFFGILSASANAESAISQGFQTADTNITAGSLISVTTTGGRFAGPSNTNNVANLVGVAGNKPLVALSNGVDNNLQVIVSGSTDALVSNINGDIKIGDKITASPINGIGMVAVSSGEIVGTAQTDLKSVHTINENLTKSDGTKANVQVGMIPLEVNVSYYTAPESKSAVSQFLPPFLQNLANSLSGKQVSPWRVLIGTIALILGFVASMVMLYASIRSNMISIGRNPLARGELRKGFFDVSIFAVGVLIITLAATFLILKV